MIKKDITKRINIDDFENFNYFEIYFFNYLKILNKDKENWIIIYTLKKDDNVFNYLVNSFLNKVEKISDYLSLNNIIIKFFNIPFCITNNKELIKKYLISDIFYNKIYVIPKNNKNCYNCNYYFICSWNKNDNFLTFETENISKVNFEKKIYLILAFFESIWISRNSIYFDFLFDLEKNFEYLNNNLTKKIELFIDWTKWILYDDYFLDTDNEVEWVRTNLIFQNYIYNKKFQLLLKKIGMSVFISYTIFDIYIYKSEKNIFKTDDDWIKNYKWISYWFLRKKNISLYIKENLVFEKKIDIWCEIKWNVKFNNLKYLEIKKLKVIHLKDLEDIKFWFENYVVLFFEHDLNQHIPYIYKFKYFISFNKLEFLAHYSIIFREIWANYIDSIWTGYFYWFKNNDLLEIDFSTWIIKRIW